MQKQKVSFYTQGCRLNQAETAVMEQDFNANGFDIVDFKSPSDIVVVNTCTVTENGDADTRRLVNRINRENPGAKIALVGCQAQVLKDKLLQLPHVNWVVGNAQKMQLPQLFAETRDAEPQVVVEKIKRDYFTVDTPGIDKKHKRANLKIQDGCDFYCAFCVIPFARGPARSRVYNDIFKEAAALAQAGHKEQVLTGINIATYDYEGKGILDVIKDLEPIEGLERIRISSIEPTTIPKDLIYHMATSEKLCNYFHIPIQAASDEVLKGMARKYSLQEFDDFVHFVRNAVPDVCIGTDVIVGFPGETDDIFEKSVDYLREAPIDYFHVFTYSEREYARSKKLPDQIPPQVKAERSRTLRELSARKKHVYMSQFVGRHVPVLFERKKQGLWTGVTEHYIRVTVDSSEDLENQIRHVTLLAVNDDHMRGEL